MDQVDFDREVIIIPKTKNGERLVQPMIEPLKVLLQELPPQRSVCLLRRSGEAV
jgi:hypothetical protein